MCINLSCWIRIGIWNADPVPGGQLLPTNIDKSSEISAFEVPDVLFWGLKASTVALIKKYFIFTEFFSPHFVHKNPGFGTDPDLDPDLDQQLEKNYGSGSVSGFSLNQCGSETRETSIYRYLKLWYTLEDWAWLGYGSTNFWLICTLKVNQLKVDVTVLRQALARALPPS